MFEYENDDEHSILSEHEEYSNKYELKSDEIQQILDSVTEFQEKQTNILKQTDVLKETEIPLKSELSMKLEEPQPENQDGGSKVTSVDDFSLTADEIDELRELLKNWLELDEATKELSERMKDIKAEKKQYETYILEFMDKTKKEIIKASDSNLILRKDVKETKSKPNEEIILKVLTRVLNNSEQAYKCTQEILDEVPVKEAISLKKESDKPKKQTKRTTKRLKN